MNQAKEILLNNGYSQINRTNNFYKLNGDFYTVVYFQRKSDGNAYFVNVGIHPLFLNSGVIEEVDCVLRTRLGIINNINGINQSELKEVVKETMEFTSQYSSYASVFSSTEPEKDIERDLLLKNFSITKVNLCRLYVEYYDSLDSKILALSFASYGLSITPKIASVPKKFFKTYISSGEILKYKY